MTSFLPIADGPNVNSKLYDNVYVSSSNSLTSAARVVSSQSSKLSLPSKSFGGEVQVINLPQNMLLGHTQLVLKVNPASVPPGSYLLDDWGYSAIQYYEYVFSDSERLRIDPQQLFIKNLADVESGEKKKAIHDLSQIKNGASFAAGLQPIPSVYTKGYYTANISLYLPFSNLSSSRIHPFPSDILPRPVQLTIAFAPWINVLQYPAGNASTVSTAISNQNYADLYVMCKTMYLLDPSDSIKELVSLRGDSKYIYPYMYPQSFVSSLVIPGMSALGSNQGTDTAPVGIMSATLTRFLNANLQSIDLFLLRLTAGNVAGTPATSLQNDSLTKSAWNPNYYSPMINCRLSYAGQTIWQSYDNSDVLMNLSEYPTTTTYDTSIYPFAIAQTNTGTFPTQTDPLLSATAVKSQWTHIQLSQLNERFYSNLSQVGPTLHTNEVLFEFNVLPRRDQENYGVTQDFSIQPTYRLYCVYNYSAGVRVAKSAANLIFQPELSVLPSVSGIEGTY